MSKPGVFVVTGCSSGIGLGITRRILSEGHSVFGIARNPEKLAAIKDLNFTGFAADLSDASATHLATAALRQLGVPVLGLVNNAGVYDRIPFHLTSDAIWERQFHSNLLSAVRLTRELYPELLQSKGSVLNISSTLGENPVADTSAYSALKAAMVNFTKTLAIEMAEHDVRVNCICPGLVDTPIHSFANEEAKIPFQAMQPLKRMGTAEEIASAAWFLLSQESAWTTGTIFRVDGGISL